MLNNNKNNRLFFCADDFGLHKTINEKIIKLIEENKIQRVSIMLGKGSDFSYLDKLKKSTIKIDLHLTLDEEAKDLTKSKNILVRIFYFLIKLFKTKKITAGWQMQIDIFKKIFGRQPDGLNSHEHIHFFPSLFPIFVELAKRNNIKYIRSGKNVIGRGMIVQILGILGKINWFLWERHSQLETNAYLSCFDWIDFNSDFMKKYQHKKIEIVCHSGKSEDFEKMKQL